MGLTLIVRLLYYRDYHNVMFDCTDKKSTKLVVLTLGTEKLRQTSKSSVVKPAAIVSNKLVYNSHVLFTI